MIWLLTLILSFSAWSQSQLSLTSPAPQAPSSVGASAYGARGGTTLYYWVIARYPGGASSATMAQAFSTVGSGNLTGSNFVRVSWAPAAGATGYDVLRSESPVFPGPSCGACAVILNTGSTSSDDTGGAMSAYPPGGLNSAVPVSATLTINVRDEAAPYVNLQLLSIRLNETLRVALISGTPADNDCLKYAAGRVLSAGGPCGSGGGGTALTAAAPSGGDNRLMRSVNDSREMEGTSVIVTDTNQIVAPGGVATGDGSETGKIILPELAVNGPDYASWEVPDAVTDTQRLLIPPTVNAVDQTLRFAGQVAGKSQSSWSNPLWRNTGTSLPGTCTVGESFQKTDVPPASQWYLCTATNTWTAQVGSGTSITSGAYGSLPATCTTGDLYLFEDSLLQYARCTATDTWGKTFVDGKTITVPPASGSYTAVTTGATGTCTFGNDAGSLYIGCDATTAISNYYTAATPGGDTWTLTMGVRLICAGSVCGVSFGTSTTNTNGTGAQAQIMLTMNSGASIVAQTRTNWAFSANPFAQTGVIASSFVYLRIAQTSGGNKIYSVSTDRKIWRPVYTVAASTAGYYYVGMSGLGQANIFDLVIQ